MLARTLFLAPVLASLASAEPTVVRAVAADGKHLLQTGVIEYVHASGVRVSLVATVHVAEPGYFAAIRARFGEADAIVVEGIDRRRTRPVISPAEPPAGLARQQQMLPTRGERFVRGDLTEEAFEQARDPAVPVGQVPADRVGLAMSVVGAVTDPGTRRATERAFAIPARNAAAIAALKHRLARGDGRIILLYGASHAADLDRRLIDDLGFARAETTWLDAFSF
jgi:hypothetical protein